MMRVLFFMLSAPLLAAAEFEPLVSLPWKEQPDAPLEAHVERLYRESDEGIRYPVLAAYLRQIPVSQLESAFEHGLRLEGTQRPERFLTFFLPIWAERDPKTAWKRVEPLFDLEDTDWLSYDSWANEKITFRNLGAMRKSSIWVEPRCLENFLGGLSLSKISEAEKMEMRVAFKARWKAIYDSEPSEKLIERTEDYVLNAEGLLEALVMPQEAVHESIGRADGTNPSAAVKMLFRRWLVSKPADALLIVSLAERRKADSDELLMLWHERAPKSFQQWLEAQFLLPHDQITHFDLLWGHLNEVLRKKWLARNRTTMPESDWAEFLAEIFYQWANWQPEDAMREAIRQTNARAISRVAENAVYGHASSRGRRFIRDLDLTRLPAEQRDEMFDEWYILMEAWGDIDIGEAARYGLHFMLATDYAPRENLIKLFSGDDAFGSDSDMIDRTFCALRLWAVLKPDEMRAWIPSQTDPEMRHALTWLLDHPWGHELGKRP